MQINIEHTIKFKLDLKTKYCILNKLGPTYSCVEYKAFFRTKDLNELITITPSYDSRAVGLPPYVNSIDHCFVQFKPNCRLIKFKPNLEIQDVTTLTTYNKFDNVLGNPNYKTSFTQVEQDKMAPIKLRTFIIPATKMKEACNDIHKDLFFNKI